MFLLFCFNKAYITGKYLEEKYISNYRICYSKAMDTKVKDHRSAILCKIPQKLFTFVPDQNLRWIQKHAKFL